MDTVTGLMDRASKCTDPEELRVISILLLQYGHPEESKRVNKKAALYDGKAIEVKPLLTMYIVVGAVVMLIAGVIVWVWVAP